MVFLDEDFCCWFWGQWCGAFCFFLGWGSLYKHRIITVGKNLLPNNVYRILANSESSKTEIIYLFIIYYPDVKIGICNSKSVIIQKYLLTIPAQTMCRNGGGNATNLDFKYSYAWAMLTVTSILYAFRV